MSRMLMAALLLVSAHPALAEVFCVNTAAGLQSALTTAATNGQDDEVRIVQGTYVGNFFYTSTEAQALSVLGGYTAGCAGRLVDPVNTILDGNQTNRVLALLNPYVAAEFLVEGLTLRKGKSTSGYGGGLYANVSHDGTVTVNRNRLENNTAGLGGGVSISSTPTATTATATTATATLTNNTITDNTANGDGGGAIFFYIVTATLINNSITGNTANSGGGVAINANNSSDGDTATLINNSITGNTANGDGGGVSISGIPAVTTATLTNNTITGNTANGDGGGASISASTATLTSNTIMGNTANSSFSQGGGFVITTSWTTATLTSNTITGNTANSGGGFSIDYAVTATLANNSITGNTAGSTGGGAIIDYIVTATLINNSITGNTANFGGGVVAIDANHPLYGSTATLINNSITGNTASMGGGFDLSLGNSETTDKAELYNNLFWDNVATDNQGADLLIFNDGDDDYLPTPVTLLANNFDQSPTGFSSTLPITLDPTNLNWIDPLFVDASIGDFHLQSGSPMIDAGYPDTPDLPSTDLAGGLRVVNGTVDIGAYEYHEFESCDVGPLVFSDVTFDAGGDHHLSEVSIATEGSVEILSEADVALRAPILSFGSGFRIETGAQFMALAGPVNCNQ